MVLNKNANVGFRRYYVRPVSNRVSMVTNNFTDAVKDGIKFLEIELYKFDLALILWLDLVVIIFVLGIHKVNLDIAFVHSLAILSFELINFWLLVLNFFLVIFLVKHLGVFVAFFF